jgi:hypothetical protein
VTFTTSVLGTAPIALQWSKDGSAINGQTNASLTLANVSAADAGTYTLRAANAAGTNTQNATLNVFTPTGYANVTNDLVLHLRFDGNANDSSGRGNNGTPSATTAPGFVPGVIGSQALECATTLAGTAVATASFVTLGTLDNIPADLQFGATTSFSVSLWTKMAAGAVPGDLPFIGTETNSANNPGWVLAPGYGTGGWQWNLNDGANNIGVSGPNNSINDGTWHNFLVSVDRSTQVVNAYLDGVLASSRSIAGLGNINNNNHWPITIGQDPTGLYPEASTNVVDDIGIWRRALTPLEAANVAAAGSAGRSFDTVAPPSVVIGVSRTGSSVTLTWTQGTLLQADTPDAPSGSWTPVAGAAAPSYTFTPATTGSKYYKVLLPP